MNNHLYIGQGMVITRMPLILIQMIPVFGEAGDGVLDRLAFGLEDLADQAFDLDSHSWLG
jgi:hypothetical protein